MARPKSTQVSTSSTMSFASSSAVTVRVGEAPDTKDFIAHESFLTSRSEFFRRAMNGNWKEPETRVVNLLDDKAHIFAHYIEFVYTGQLPITSKTIAELEDLTSKEFADYITEQYAAIFGVFVLGEKLQDLSTKNSMMQGALDVVKLSTHDNRSRAPTPRVVKAIYSGTPPGSPARRFVTDLWTSRPIGDILKQVNHCPQDFVQDLAESFDKARPSGLGNIAVKNGIAAYQEKPEEL